MNHDVIPPWFARAKLTLERGAATEHRLLKDVALVIWVIKVNDGPGYHRPPVEVAVSSERLLAWNPPQALRLAESLPLTIAGRGPCRHVRTMPYQQLR